MQPELLGAGGVAGTAPGRTAGHPAAGRTAAPGCRWRGPRAAGAACCGSPPPGGCHRAGGPPGRAGLRVRMFGAGKGQEHMSYSRIEVIPVLVRSHTPVQNCQHCAIVPLCETFFVPPVRYAPGDFHSEARPAAGRGCSTRTPSCGNRQGHSQLSRLLPVFFAHANHRLGYR